MRYVERGYAGPDRLLHEVKDRTGDLRERVVTIGVAQVHKLVAEFVRSWEPADSGKYELTIEPPEFAHDEGDTEDDRAWRVTWKRLTLREWMAVSRKKREEGESDA